MIFQKPSTRTRVSFEVGIASSAAHGLYLAADDLQLGRGETIKDTAVVLSRYLDAIMIRTFAQDDVEELAEHARRPGDQRAHRLRAPVPGARRPDDDPRAARPALGRAARLPRRREQRVRLADGRRGQVRDALRRRDARRATSPTRARSAPRGAPPCRWAARSSSSATRGRPRAAPTSLYTDVWTSMGQEDEAERRRATSPAYRIDAELLAQAAPDAIVLHCLPAHYGEEITEEVAVRAAVGGLGPGREPPARAEGAARARRAVAVLPLKDNVPTRRSRSSRSR